MSDCAKCGVSVYVADGLEFEDGDLCYSCKDDLIEELEQEIEQWKTWGIIEIAVRNSNVMEYMKRWEGRALKAEAKNVKLETPKFDTSGICELCDKEYIRKRRKQRFCSDKCRVAAAMRRFRKNKQEDTNGPEPELTV